MINVILENLVNIAAAAVIMLIGVLGSYLTLKLSQRTELKSINAAQQEVILMAQQTVGELQQTVVAKLKEASIDGKLSKAEIAELSRELLSRTVQKLSTPTQALLKAAEVDIVTLIQGAGEAWINDLKKAN